MITSSANTTDQINSMRKKRCSRKRNSDTHTQRHDYCLYTVFVITSELTDASQFQLELFPFPINLIKLSKRYLHVTEIESIYHNNAVKDAQRKIKSATFRIRSRF